MLICYFDGACEPINPGGTASYGVVVFRGVGGIPDYKTRLWEDYAVCQESGTSNNVAEYAGFNAALDWFLNWEGTREPTIIRGDSKLVIEQMNGHWQIRNGLYKPLALICREKLKEFVTKPAIEWIPREKNTEADRLSKKALEEIGIKPRNWKSR